MSRLIKIIDENTIELAEYRCPEVIFKNSQTPPTLQNIKDEIEHLEWYCTFKTTINPFQMYAENERLKEEYMILQNASDEVEEEKDRETERLNNIINEFEEWLKDYISLFDKPDMLEEQTLEDLKEVLNKLQELKGVE